MFCIMFATVEGGFFGAASCLRMLLLTVRSRALEEYTMTAPVPSSQTMQPLIQLCFLAYRDEVALVDVDVHDRKGGAGRAGEHDERVLLGQVGDVDRHGGLCVWSESWNWKCCCWIDAESRRKLAWLYT